MATVTTQYPKKKIYHICPVCKRCPCYDHCNNCGKTIKIRKNEYDQWKAYESGTDIIHRGCMKRGTRDGQYKDVNNKQENKYWGIGIAFDKALLLSGDNLYMREAKMKLQDKLKADLSKERKYPVPESWYAHTFNVK